ncbi:MAG: metallophosphoesterase family protein [Myxococcota bacterium]
MSPSQLTRVGVIGDVHCQDRTLQRAIAFFEEEAMDRILCVGDIVDGPGGDVDRCCTLLREHRVATVRGNHERWLLRGELRNLPDATLDVAASSRIFLEGLPVTLEFQTPQGTMMLCHGIGEDDMVVVTGDTRGYGLQHALAEVRHREELRYLVCGHTHQRMVRTLGTLTLLNAGTLHPGYNPCVMSVDFERGVATHHDIDESGVRKGVPVRFDARVSLIG